MRLSLTDAPREDLKSVFVNVKYAEMRLSGSGKEARLIVARNLGAVDLLTLQNGVTLPMADVTLPENVTVTQIRLVLESEGNYIIKEDGSRCDMKTPSGQQSGVKFIIKNGVKIEEGYSYSIIADFDAKKSVVLQGNGGCLLKPVIKLHSASRIELPPAPTPTPEPTATPNPDTGGGGGVEATPTPAPTPVPTPEPVPDGDGSTQVDDGSGFDGGGSGGTGGTGGTGGGDTPPEVPEDDIVHYF